MAFTIDPQKNFLEVLGDIMEHMTRRFHTVGDSAAPYSVVTFAVPVAEASDPDEDVASATFSIIWQDMAILLEYMGMNELTNEPKRTLN